MKEVTYHGDIYRSYDGKIYRNGVPLEEEILEVKSMEPITAIKVDDWIYFNRTWYRPQK